MIDMWVNWRENIGELVWYFAVKQFISKNSPWINNTVYLMELKLLFTPASQMKLVLLLGYWIKLYIFNLEFKVTNY